MTPEDIEKALEQPEFNKHLVQLAEAEVFLEKAVEQLDAAMRLFNETFDFMDNFGIPDILTDEKNDFFKALCLPLGNTAAHLDNPWEIAEDYYNDIKARLLSPAYRLKQTLESSS